MHPNDELAVFVVWSDQMGGAPEFVADAAKLMPDRRARHFWDGERIVGRAYQRLKLRDQTIQLSAEAWDTYLLFDCDASWPKSSPPPAPVWWEHQLQGAPDERRLDAARFAAKAVELARAPE
jgi:hypothetical protein